MRDLSSVHVVVVRSWLVHELNRPPAANPEPAMEGQGLLTITMALETGDAITRKL